MRILGPPSQPADGTEAGWDGGPKIRICVTPAILLLTSQYMFVFLALGIQHVYHVYVALKRAD